MSRRQLDNFNWHFAAPDDPLRSVVNTKCWLEPAQIVKQNYRRTVYRLTMGMRTVYVKHDHPTSPRNAVKSLWRCKSQQEYQAGQALDAAGVPVVPYVAWANNGVDSILVTEELPGALAFETAWLRCRDDATQRRAFLTGLKTFLGELVRARVNHPDFHVGNILVVLTNDSVHFQLVDVYGVKTDGSGHGWDLRLFAGIVGLSRQLSRSELLELLPRHNNDRHKMSRNRLWRDVIGWHRDRVKARWPGRRRRLLTHSSLCEKITDDHGVWLILKPFSLDDARQAITAHAANFSRGEQIVKTDVKRQLSRVNIAGQSYIVKEFRKPGPWGRWRPDYRSWLNHHRLDGYGMPTARSWAWLRSTDGRGFLILDDLGTTTVADLLQNGIDSKRRCQLMNDAGRLIGWLHSSGIIHRDLTPANFMATTEPLNSGLRVALVDCDDVRFRTELNTVNRAYNVGQMINILMLIAPLTASLRLLVAYRKEFGLTQWAIRDVISPNRKRRQRPS